MLCLVKYLHVSGESLLLSRSNIHTFRNPDPLCIWNRRLLYVLLKPGTNPRLILPLQTEHSILYPAPNSNKTPYMSIAAAMPPMPPPTMVTFFRISAGSAVSLDSLPKNGFITQEAGRRLLCSPTQPEKQISEADLSYQIILK